MGDRAAKDALFEGLADVAKAPASGQRAEIVDLLTHDAVQELRKRGFDASRLEDGFPEWKRAGRPVAVGE